MRSQYLSSEETVAKVVGLWLSRRGSRGDNGDAINKRRETTRLYKSPGPKSQIVRGEDTVL
jgi:hypothetical protein